MIKCISCIFWQPKEYSGNELCSFPKLKQLGYNVPIEVTPYITNKCIREKWYKGYIK